MPTTFLLALVVHSFITCKTGVPPVYLYDATIDLNNNHMTFADSASGTRSRGPAVVTEMGDAVVYHLNYGFGIGVELEKQAGDWYLCIDNESCFRCGEFIKP